MFRGLKNSTIIALVDILPHMTVIELLQSTLQAGPFVQKDSSLGEFVPTSNSLAKGPFHLGPQLEAEKSLTWSGRK